jgi:putative colanic acid biosynthesis glycosyltransferase
MRFSIITVTYNNLAGLRATQASIYRLRHDLFEWIVVDGASTDGTKEYLKGVGANNARYISEPDRGIYDAMNKGLRISKGEYCIFMNAGDRFATGSILSDVDELIGKTEPYIVYGDAIEVDGEKRWLKQARQPSKNFYSMFTHHQSIFYRRKVIENGYDLSYRFSGDWALTTRVLKLPSCETLRYPHPICLFERGGVSQRDDHRKEIDEEHWKICRQEMKLGRVQAFVIWYAKRQVNKFRKAAPSIYNAVRFKPGL